MNNKERAKRMVNLREETGITSDANYAIFIGSAGLVVEFMRREQNELGMKMHEEVNAMRDIQADSEDAFFSKLGDIYDRYKAIFESTFGEKYDPLTPSEFDDLVKGELEG